MKVFYYHENNLLHPGLPQEDSADSAGDIFAVADGITHDRDAAGNYPAISEAAVAADLTVKALVSSLRNGPAGVSPNFTGAFTAAQEAVREFNAKSSRYLQREQNHYDFSACVAAVVIVDHNKLLYGVLDDCRVQVFSPELEPGIKLEHYVDEAAEYYYRDHDWNDLESRKFMRKEIRNQVYQTPNGKSIGYGVIDGFGNYIPYLQIGSCQVASGDLTAVFTDGFIPALNDKDFLKLLMESDFNPELDLRIRKFLRVKGIDREKTAFFIKI